MTEYERWHAMKLDDPDLTEELNAIEGNQRKLTTVSTVNWNLEQVVYVV